MSFDPKKARQTQIIDGAAAIAIGQRQQGKRKTATSKPKSKSGTFKLSAPKRNDGTPTTKVSGAIAAGSPKAAPNPRSLPTFNRAPRFYEVDGVQIPLFEANGKRRAYARSGEVLAHRYSRIQLLEMVKKYAESKAEEFRRKTFSRREIAKWIEEVETLALGPNPKSLARKPTADESGEKLGEKVESISREVIVDSRVHNKSLKAERETHSSPQPKVLRKKRYEIANDAPRSYVSLNEHSRSEGKRKRNEAVDNTLLTQTPKKAKKYYHDKHPQIEPAAQVASTSPKPCLPKHIEEEDDDHELRELVEACITEEHDALVSSTIGMEQFNKKTMTRHPLIDFLILDPIWPGTSTVVADLPERKQRVVVTATSETAVHTTCISYSVHSKNVHKLRPRKLHSRPYLKPGSHGWDYKLHRWSFEGDKDLETGVGHQVDPQDEERLRRDSGWGAEFKRKYPGVLENQWPCGCQKPWCEDDSEEE